MREPTGKKPRWAHPGLGKHNKRPPRQPQLQPQPHATSAKSKIWSVSGQQPAGTPDATGDAEREGGDDDEGDVAPETKRGIAEERRAEEVQILDLHSRKPLVSYDGHVYSCQWAENIGTEMLFTAFKEDDDLPILRKLPGDVALLAASSARIISTSANLQRKPISNPELEAEEEEPNVNGKRPYNRRGPQIKISSNKVKPQRKAQADFLNRLIKLKEEKGEEDYVTVNARKRLTNTGWRMEVRAARQKERIRLKRVIKTGWEHDQEVIEAQEKLEELDAEEKKMREVEARKGIGADGKKKRTFTGTMGRPLGSDRKTKEAFMEGLVKYGSQGGTPGLEFETYNGGTPAGMYADVDMDGGTPAGIYGDVEGGFPGGEFDGEILGGDETMFEYATGGQFGDQLSDADAPGEIDDTLYE